MPQRRALVVDDEPAAHSWWACTLVVGAHKREPTLTAASHDAALQLIAADDNTGTILITADQAELLGVKDGMLQDARATVFSREWLYDLSDLSCKRDRHFRKACNRAEAALEERGLCVHVHAGAAITEELIHRCMRCRGIWLGKKRALASNTRAGAPARALYLAALSDKRLLPSGAPNPHLAVFVISGRHGEEQEDEQASTSGEDVIGYVVTERVGRTIVAVDGVHDYSVSDPRADPSALLLHAAASWWLDPSRAAAAAMQPPPPTPCWLNDGPCPTPGLLKYKSQYHGRLLHVLALTPHWRAIARARWKAALSWVLSRRKFMRKLHVGDKAIRRAAKRIYFYSSSTPTPSVL